MVAAAVVCRASQGAVQGVVDLKSDREGRMIVALHKGQVGFQRVLWARDLDMQGGCEETNVT